MKPAFTVNLKEPIEHEGELFDSLSFRGVLASDIEQGLISLNELTTLDENDIDNLLISGLKLAKTLSVKPKLGKTAGNLPLEAITAILKGFGEYQKNLHQNIQEDENTPDPLFSSPEED